MPGGHGIQRHGHRLIGGRHQRPGGDQTALPFLQPVTELLTFNRGHHRIRTLAEQLIPAAEPVFEVRQQGLQQRCHQLTQLVQLLQSEDVQAAVAHAEATARSRQAILEQKQREEREAAARMDEVEVVGERSWAQRDDELRAAAVEVEE